MQGSVEGRQERGFTAHTTKNGHLPLPARSVAPAGADLEIDEQLQEVG